MRLAALLAELTPDQLERLRAEHLGEDEHVTRATLAATLEGVLRSYAFVRKFVGDRFPPTFAILETLLDADGFAHPAATFRDVIGERTKRLVERVKSGDLVGRSDGLRLYRRVLLEARRNDLVLDASETAILGVLRRELNIRPVEHFLVEHHSDFHEFWANDEAFLDQMHALRSCGLVFGHGGNIVLAEEVVPLVRQTLGLDMSLTRRRRLYGHLTGQLLTDVLAGCEAKSAGSRDEKLERLLGNYIQPIEVLSLLPLTVLRDLCRDLGASVSGSKDELVERLVDHVMHDADIAPPDAATSKPVTSPEPRELSPVRFRALFAALRGDDLTDILTGIDSSRVTGGKDTKVELLVSSPFAELTLLDKLTSKSLEENLHRHHLKTVGSKRERAERLVEHYRTLPDAMLEPEAAPPSVLLERPIAPRSDRESSAD